MKITDLKTFVVGNPPPRFGGRYFLFVKLTTDDGIVGGRGLRRELRAPVPWWPWSRMSTSAM